MSLHPFLQIFSLRAVPCRSLCHGADPLNVPAGLGLQVRTSALTYLLVVVRKQMSDINVLPRYPSPAPAVASVFHYGPQPLRQRDTGSPSSPPLRWLLAALLDVQKRTPSSAAQSRLDGPSNATRYARQGRRSLNMGMNMARKG